MPCSDGSSAQKWVILPGGYIQGLDGMCLDITEGSPTASAFNGQPVTLWNCTGNANQDWTLIT